jgi:AmiR/NasT family two-component response regulator
LKQAACQVAARYNCTLQEADKWIQQEARAKRVNLIEVAAAVLAGRSVDYHYDIPV